MFHFFQHIYHTGHQNSKWTQNKTFFGVLRRSLLHIKPTN